MGLRHRQGGGWGNNELEYYTSRTNNARIVGGQLVIEADQESYGGSSYTSARMLTKGKWSWAYGRMEARIKIPRGQGIWPAFWMLGTNIDSVGWPTCGEIDIMENIGKTSDQGTAHGTIHGPQSGGDYNGGAGVGGTYTLPGGAALADDFHIFAVEWTTNQIKWFVDTNQYFTATPASLPSGGTWVFTQPQFLILNVAVGGNWPGNPDGTTVFPQQMLVDYVRVYSYVVSSVPDVPTGLNATAGGTQVVLSWSASTASDQLQCQILHDQRRALHHHRQYGDDQLHQHRSGQRQHLLLRGFGGELFWRKLQFSPDQCHDYGSIGKSGVAPSGHSELG